MPTYPYSSLGQAWGSTYLHYAIADSAMTAKGDYDGCNYDQSAGTADVVFSSTLSGGDETILDGLVSDAIGEDGWQPPEAYEGPDSLSEDEIMIGGATNTEKKEVSWLVDDEDPTGFDRDVDGLGDAASIGEISFVNATRTFTIEPAVGESSFWFFVRGIKFTKSSAENIVIPDTEHVHYIYYDETGTLQTTTTFNDALIVSYAYIASIRWDATNNEEILFADERHGYRMSGKTHLHLHKGFGSRYYSGLDLGDLVTDGSGNDNTHCQFSYSAGSLGDEDIILEVSAASAPSNIPVYYKTGSNGDWRLKTSDNFPLIYSGTAGYTGSNGRIPYNEWTGSTWQLTEVSNDGFIVMLYFATNDSSRPIVGIQGQNEYTSLNSAREGIISELNTFVKGEVDFVEFVSCWGLIVQTNGSYSNTPAARFRLLDNGDDYIDLRSFIGVSAGSSGGYLGDVVGPASSTDNAVVHFDSTTGKLIQDSNVIVDDTGNITVPGNVDGRDIATDGTKLDTIESGAEVNNISDANATLLTGGTSITLHTHSLAKYIASGSSLGTSSTTSYSPQQKLRVTTPSLVSGTRYVIFYCMEVGCSANEDVGMRCQLNDTTTLTTMTYKNHPYATRYFSYSNMYISDSLSGVYNIDLDYERDYGTQSVYARNANILVLEIP